MTHPVSDRAIPVLLALSWPWIALYAVLLGVMIYAAVDNWRRRTVTWRGQGWAMTLPRRPSRARLDLQPD